MRAAGVTTAGWTWLRLITLVIFVLLTGCSSRNPRPGFVPEHPNIGSANTIPRGSDEEHALAEYKSYYERFRIVETVDSSLSIQQEAKLTEEYANAREAFDYWLWFVADSIQQQSELEPEGPDIVPSRHRTKPHHATEYRDRAEAALYAIDTFDKDLSEILQTQKPPELSSRAAQPYSLGYRLVTVFSHLDLETAQIAAEELKSSYFWNKQ
jgi:hypothetical protein